MRGEYIFIIIQIIVVILSKLLKLNFFSYISYFNIIFFFIYKFRYQKKEFFLYFYIIIFAILHILGIFIIENNSFYLKEIDKISYFKGIVPDIILIYIIFISYLKIDKEVEYKQLSNCLLNKILVIIFFMYSLYFFLKIGENPYYKLKVDRFLYRENYLSLFERRMIDLYMIPVLYSYRYLLKKNRDIFSVISIINILMIIVALFNLGAKFEEYLTIVLFSLGIYILNLSNYQLKKNIKKLVKNFSYGVMGILILLIVHYSKANNGYKFQEFRNFMFQRAAQQGQLYWGTYEYTRNGEIEELIEEFKTENKYKVNKEIKEQVGIWKIMRLTTPVKIVERKAKAKSMYTNSTPASLNYYFGILGNIIFYIIAGIGMKQLYKLFFKMDVNGMIWVLQLLVFFKIRQLTNSIIYMSNFSAMIDTKFFLYCILGVILFNIRKLSKINKY